MTIYPENTNQQQTIPAEAEPGDLGLLFRRAARLMLRGHHHHHHGPVHPAQGRVLALLQERSPISQRALMEELGVRSGSLSELLAKLERHALIERTRDEEDKRGFVISLTAHGDALVAEHALRERELSRALFAPLDAEERSQLRGLLQKLTEAWEQEGAEDECGHGRHGAGRGPGRHGCRRMHGRSGVDGEDEHHDHGSPHRGGHRHTDRERHGRGADGEGRDAHQEPARSPGRRR